MSEQHTTRKKQNIIRFPASPRERRRLLRENKDPRVRLTGTLRTVSGWLLVCGALLMLAVERLVAPRQNSMPVQNIDELTPMHALGIGIFQCMALWPGFSRSASTIMGGMILGVRREIAAEYSFLAAVPIIIGAAGYDLWKSISLFSTADIPFFLTGSVFAFVSAIVAIRGFIAILGRNTLKPFAIYRILLAIPVYWFMVS